MIRIIFTVITLLLPFAFVTAQTSEVDSLIGCFNRAQTDSAKCFYATELAAKTYRTNTDTALIWGNKGLELARQSGITQMEATALSTLGVCYYYQGNLEKTLDYYVQSLAIAEKHGHTKSASTTLGNIGLLYAERNEFDKALDYLNRALTQKVALKDSLGIARNYANIGMVYTNKLLPDSALIYYLKQVTLCEQLQEDYGKSIGLNNVGQVYLEKKEYQIALTYFNDALTLKQVLDDKNGMSITLTNIAETYLKMGQNELAIPPLERAALLAKEMNSYPRLETPYQLFAEAYGKLGDYKKAFTYQNLLMAVKDSLNRKESLDRAEELEAKYQNEKNKIELVNQQLALERQTFYKNQILGGALVAFLLLLGLFLYVRSRQRQKQHDIEMQALIEKTEADRLRELDAIKSTFLANISHEFRTPLTLILSPLEQLLSGNLKGDLGKYYRIMHRNGTRLLDLINQLLDLSKLESGKLKLQLAEGDIRSFTMAVVGAFESLAVRNQINFQIHVPTDPVYGLFDRDKLEKILLNVVSNAFKFTPEGGQIVVTLRQTQTGVQYLVQDNGMGIPTTHIAHLFERFYRTTVTELQAGSGLGLALTRELTELHGGTIAVNSTENEGALFTIDIPIKVVPSSDHDASAFPAPVVETKYQHVVPALPVLQMLAVPTATERLTLAEKPVILIAEDNADVRAYVVEQLGHQYHILEAENGIQGLRLAAEKMPDLIITDIMMPEMDGTTFCNTLKSQENTSHIPVIMLTALAEQSEKIKGLDTGADDYLIKPFDVAELRIRVTNLIKQRRRLQEYYRKMLNVFAPTGIDAENMDAVFLRKVREAVESNMDDEQFSVVELSVLVGMSRSQLHRKLSSLTDLSPNQVIRQMRLEKAKILLDKKSGTVSEIAYLCGFSSPAYFIKCFKEHFGKTPGEISTSS